MTAASLLAAVIFVSLFSVCCLAGEEEDPLIMDLDPVLVEEEETLYSLQVKNAGNPEQDGNGAIDLPVMEVDSSGSGLTASLSEEKETESITDSSQSAMSIEIETDTQALGAAGPIYIKNTDEVISAAEVDERLAGMTLEEKIMQLFILSPEELTGIDPVTEASEATRDAIFETPVGGLMYMPWNLCTYDQIQEMLKNTQAWSMERTGLPMFICVDEEGGMIRRINGRGILQGRDEDEVPSMSFVGALGDTKFAYSLGEKMGRYLYDLGFNIDFAPVADTMTNPKNKIVMDRSFGSDPQLTASMAVCVMHGLQQYHVGSVFKHFPGHGSTTEDSHLGFARSFQTEEDLFACDLIPFKAGIDNGVDMIMTGHISLPKVTGDMTPASLSYDVITGILRKKMGYDGLVITDAMIMGAITQKYTSAESAILAVEAGNDLILIPESFKASFEGLLDAVKSGRISEDRIDESVRRILRWKMNYLQRNPMPVDESVEE